MTIKFPQTSRGVIDIKQVAALARVSPATVSRVTNQSSSVNPAMTARVWKAIQQLGYIPNPQARALVSGRSRTLGLLISEITNPFYAELLQSFEHIAADHHYEVIMGSTHQQPRPASLLITRMLQRRVEGVAAITFRDEGELLQPFVQHGVPIVTMDLPVAEIHAAALTVEYQAGIEAAVQHLAVLGHRRFAFVSGPLQHVTNIRRQDAFLQSIRNLGLKPRKQWLLEGDHTLEAGILAVNTLWAAAERPTAILCSNDLTAIGVLRSAHGHGIRVPQQLSVVGFDDVHLSSFVTPSLTTIRMSPEDIAQAAFNTLRNLRAPSEAGTPKPLPSIKCALVVRESTAKADGERTPSRKR